jgi:N-acetylneuraminic acid mutarotase
MTFQRTRITLLVLGLGAGGIGCQDNNIVAPTASEPAAASSQLLLATSGWSTKANMPTARSGLAITTVLNSQGQSIVYALGGYATGFTKLGTVEAYNVSTNTWSTKPSLPFVGQPKVGVIGGKLYTVCLDDCNFYPSTFSAASLWVYDPGTNAWTQKANMPVYMTSGLTGVINGKLYVLNTFTQMFCGGDDCGEETPHLYRYDPASNTWTSLRDCPAKHIDGAAAVVNGKFYVAGGSSKKLHVYDPATNSWSEKAQTLRRRWGAAGAHLQGEFYVIGGRDSLGNSLRSVQAYNPATNTWVNKPPLLTARVDLGATRVLVDGQQRIVTIGGQNRSYNALRTTEAYTP